jgi:hypothetical protein
VVSELWAVQGPDRPGCRSVAAARPARQRDHRGGQVVGGLSRAAVADQRVSSAVRPGGTGGTGWRPSRRRGPRPTASCRRRPAGRCRAGRRPPIARPRVIRPRRPVWPRRARR